MGKTWWKWALTIGGAIIAGFGETLLCIDNAHKTTENFLSGLTKKDE